MVTDPLNALAHSIFSNKGVYALLLGSGVSRAAEIPTGWEITLNLIKQIAALEGQNAGDKPDEWFFKNKGRPADYAVLLNSLPGTPEERQAIIRSYIEPSEEDREAGRKIPTRAHHAIAELVEYGYIRVILTTNFDRLLEVALSQRGIEPIVVSSDDDIQGAAPISHGRCFVVKVHGDYLDSRIKNTPEELDSYSKETNEYIDKIFDQFGLIICGWSGAWDTSLKKAIRRCPSRRYSTFWAAKGAIHPEAEELIRKRDAKVIEIQDADKFFDDLKEKVRALEDLRSPALIDVRMATAIVKRYLAEDKHRIRLRDLVIEQTGRTMDALGPASILLNASWNAEEFEKRLKVYEAETEILRAMLAVGAFWSTGAQSDLWTEVIQRLSLPIKPQSGKSAWLELRYYPVVLAFYTAGIAATAAGNYTMLNKLMQTKVVGNGYETVTTPESLLPSVVGIDTDYWKIFIEYKDKYFPVNEYLYKVMKMSMKEIEPDPDRFEIYFDRFELLASLSYGYEQLRKDFDIYRFPPGRWYKFNRTSDAQELKGYLDEADERQNEWPPLTAGMFGGAYENFKRLRESFDLYVQKLLADLKWQRF